MCPTDCEILLFNEGSVVGVEVDVVTCVVISDFVAVGIIVIAFFIMYDSTSPLLHRPKYYFSYET